MFAVGPQFRANKPRVTQLTPIWDIEYTVRFDKARRSARQEAKYKMMRRPSLRWLEIAACDATPQARLLTLSRSIKYQ